MHGLSVPRGSRPASSPRSTSGAAGATKQSEPLRSSPKIWPRLEGKPRSSSLGRKTRGDGSTHQGRWNLADLCPSRPPHRLVDPAFTKSRLRRIHSGLRAAQGPSVPSRYARPLSDEPGHGHAEVPGRKGTNRMTVRKREQIMVLRLHSRRFSAPQKAGFRTKAEAEEAEKRKREEIRLGRRRFTLAQAFEMYLTANHMKDRAGHLPRSLASEHEPVLGHYYIEEVDTSSTRPAEAHPTRPPWAEVRQSPRQAGGDCSPVHVETRTPSSGATCAR